MQLKVRLLGISPMIWRRVLVPVSISLHELHGVLQVAMGWEGVHLFAFDIYGDYRKVWGSCRVWFAMVRLGHGCVTGHRMKATTETSMAA